MGTWGSNSERFKVNHKGAGMNRLCKVGYLSSLLFWELVPGNKEKGKWIPQTCVHMRKRRDHGRRCPSCMLVHYKSWGLRAAPLHFHFLPEHLAGLTSASHFFLGSFPHQSAALSSPFWTLPAFCFVGLQGQCLPPLLQVGLPFFPGRHNSWALHRQG